MQIIAAVILFNPDENVLMNIKTYHNYVHHLLIYDNSANSNKEAFKELSKHTYVHDGNNRGIAERLNAACQFAIEHGYKFLLTMDQDSFFEEKEIVNYFGCVSAYPKISSTALFGPQFTHAGSEASQCETLKTEKLITSGCLVNLDAYREIGAFEEKLFIDEVDHEYCYRAILKNFDVIQFTHVRLQHSLGSIHLHWSAKNLMLTKRRLYNSTRMFYMVRNFLYVQAKYKKTFPKSIRESKSALLVHIKNNLLYNKSRLAVLNSIIKGYLAYKKNRWGSIQQSAVRPNYQ